MSELTKYEELMAEYDDELIIEERPIKNAGLYADGVTWIREDMTTSQKYCVLAEEIGHHKTSVGNILDQTDTDNVRQELKARKWAYEKILPAAAILTAFENGLHCIWDIAEYLDVDELFLRDAMRHYGLLD